MTIQDVIEKVQRLRSEKLLTNDFVIEKINEIEWRIKREIIDVHEGGENIHFSGYNANDLNKQLIVPEPYSGLYIKWVIYQLDIAGNEMINASNSVTLFNRDYYSFAGWYTKNHMPLSKGNMRSGGYHV